MKRIIALVCALVMLTMCSAALADSTYTHYFTAEELAGATDMNGFVSAMGMTELNTLLLKDDGTYEYTKLMGIVNEAGEVLPYVVEDQETPGAAIRYTFVGTYTREGDTVVLGVPSDCTFNEDWAVLTTGGWMSNSSGVASEGARVTNYEGTDFDPMDCFSGPLYKFDGHDTPVTVIVSADGTFSYAAVANSDDD